MESLIKFGNTASPLAILAIAVVGLVYVVIKTYKGENKINKISDTQDIKYPSLEKHIAAITKLTAQNETLLENHFKHEIPEMMKTMDKIDQKVDKIDDKVTNMSDRLLVLETRFYINKDHNNQK